MLIRKFLIPVALLFSFQSLSSVTADFVSDLEDAAKELAEDTSVENEAHKAPVEAHLRKFYDEICTIKENINYTDYFTPDGKLNYLGKAYVVGSEEMVQTGWDLSYGCHLYHYEIGDIKVHGDTAIALVTGKARIVTPEVLPFVEAVELTLTESDGWRIDVILVFAHVNYSESEHTKNKEVTAHVEKFYDELCTEKERETIKTDYTEDAMLNMAGKAAKGQAGREEELNDASSKCETLDHKIIEVEVSGNSALVLVTGHGTKNNVEHPFVEVFELREVEDKVWKTDIKWLFINFKMPN